MFLTSGELRELTGYKRPTCMIRWLRENQFVFTVAADGYPRVLSEHVQTRLTNRPASVRALPNFAVLNHKS
ncbi:MAG: DUF4224 domain-containing protein [Gammaproteobacteria bacterium]